MAIQLVGSKEQPREYIIQRDSLLAMTNDIKAAEDWNYTDLLVDEECGLTSKNCWRKRQEIPSKEKLLYTLSIKLTFRIVPSKTRKGIMAMLMPS